MEFFLGLDLSASLSGITCPVMALNGTKDTQVQCDRNIAVLKAGLPSNSRSVIRAEDGLNHLFQHCVTGEVSEYKSIEETFSPEGPFRDDCLDQDALIGGHLALEPWFYARKTCLSTFVRGWA